MPKDIYSAQKRKRESETSVKRKEANVRRTPSKKQKATEFKKERAKSILKEME